MVSIAPHWSHAALKGSKPYESAHLSASAPCTTKNRSESTSDLGGHGYHESAFGHNFPSSPLESPHDLREGTPVRVQLARPRHSDTRLQVAQDVFDLLQARSQVIGDLGR